MTDKYKPLVGHGLRGGPTIPTTPPPTLPHIGRPTIPSRPPMKIDWKAMVRPIVTDDGYVVDGTGTRLFPQSAPLTAGDMETIGKWMSLPEAERDTDGELHLEKLPVWVLELNNDQTQKIARVLTSGGGSLTVIGAGSPLSVIGAAILAAVPYVLAMNAIGGNHGVEITGVLGVLGVTVTPRLGKLPREVIDHVRQSVQGATILEALVFAAGKSPSLAAALQIPAVAAAVAAFAGATPVGWIVFEGAKWLLDQDDGGQAGAVLADRDVPKEWERFLSAHIGGNRSALLSWRGFFSAQMDGGHGVYANRSGIGPWERWTLVSNDDGTVSFRTNDDRHYLCAEEGGGRECQANRTEIGPWEKFWIEPLDDGHIALKTFTKGKYVSVQP